MKLIHQTLSKESDNYDIYLNSDEAMTLATNLINMSRGVSESIVKGFIDSKNGISVNFIVTDTLKKKS